MCVVTRATYSETCSLRLSIHCCRSGAMICLRATCTETKGPTRTATNATAADITAARLLKSGLPLCSCVINVSICVSQKCQNSFSQLVAFCIPCVHLSSNLFIDAPAGACILLLAQNTKSHIPHQVRHVGIIVCLRVSSPLNLRLCRIGIGSSGLKHPGVLEHNESGNNLQEGGGELRRELENLHATREFFGWFECRHQSVIRLAYIPGNSPGTLPRWQLQKLPGSQTISRLRLL